MSDCRTLLRLLQLDGRFCSKLVIQALLSALFEIHWHRISIHCTGSFKGECLAVLISMEVELHGGLEVDMSVVFDSVQMPSPSKRAASRSK